MNMKRFIKLDNKCLIDRKAILCVYIEDNTNNIVIVLKNDGGTSKINYTVGAQENAINALNQFQKALK